MSEIDKLAQATKKSFDKVDEQFDKVAKDFSEVKQEMKDIRQEMKDNQKTIIHEFKALAENIHQDVAGANQDKISLIAQKQDVLEKRVSEVEHKIGV